MPAQDKQWTDDEMPKRKLPSPTSPGAKRQRVKHQRMVQMYRELGGRTSRWLAGRRLVATNVHGLLRTGGGPATAYEAPVVLAYTLEVPMMEVDDRKKVAGSPQAAARRGMTAGMVVHDGTHVHFGEHWSPSAWVRDYRPPTRTVPNSPSGK